MEEEEREDTLCLAAGMEGTENPVSMGPFLSLFRWVGTDQQLTFHSQLQHWTLVFAFNRDLVDFTVKLNISKFVMGINGQIQI